MMNKKTKTFINSLPEEGRGIVLKRKFPKENDEEYYSQYIYSAWIYCEKDEVEGNIQFNLNLNFDPLSIDWTGKQKNLKKNSQLNITSTPIFLIENNGNYNDTVEHSSETDEENEIDNENKKEKKLSSNSLVLKFYNIFILLIILF